MRRYGQERIWVYIHNHPGVGSRKMREVFCISKSRMKNFLQGLRNGGNAYFVGKGTASRWYSTGKRPVCLWGTHPNSLANLEVMTLEDRLNNLRKIGRLPDKPKPVEMPAANDSCELSRCWPVLMSSGQRG